MSLEKTAPVFVRHLLVTTNVADRRTESRSGVRQLAFRNRDDDA